MPCRASRQTGRFAPPIRELFSIICLTMQSITLARHAMATRFELVLHGEDPVALRAAGEEALEEIERLESQLSLYRSNSEVCHLNTRAAHEPVRVTPTLFSLLRHARQLSEETGGAFDITVAPLMKCWGFMGGGGRLPDEKELEKARALVGMNLIHLNADDSTVRFERNGMMIDLGAIGKGYAVGVAAEILQEAGVTSALIHGGTSTIYAIGRPMDADSWKVAIEVPQGGTGQTESMASKASQGAQDAGRSVLSAVPLRDEALSVSAVWGKYFKAGEEVLGHVIDPRTGRPSSGTLLAAIALPSATETDAISTALLVSGGEHADRTPDLRPGMRSLLVTGTETDFRVSAKGMTV